MQMQKSEKLEFADMIAVAVVKALKLNGLVGTPSANPKPERTGKTAYQKTEALLYNYRNFKKIVEERMSEIEDIKKYGVAQRSGSVVEYGNRTNKVKGLRTEEESVQSAVYSVQTSVEETVRVISMIDKAMAALKSDPYYPILEMRYFEGRTQEDIADHLGCSQVTISKNKAKLVNELSMRLFPGQAVSEMLE